MLGRCLVHAAAATRGSSSLLRSSVAYTTASTTAPQHNHYDCVVVGSGPAAGAWVRTWLESRPGARVLVLERGPHCLTNILTDANPFKLWRDSGRMVAQYAHSVAQGAALGGCSAVNQCAWVTPSLQDITAGFGADMAAQYAAHIESFEAFADRLVHKPPIHILSKLMTEKLPADMSVHTGAHVRVCNSHRNSLILTTPTVDGDGARRSSYTGVLQPLLRPHFRTLDIIADSPVRRVLFNTSSPSTAPVACGVECADGRVYHAGLVVAAGGALETPALLMRSGVGSKHAVAQAQGTVVVANEHVGAHLRDKVGVHDILLCSARPGGFDNSLFIMNMVTARGATVQLHRLDRALITDNYITAKRLLQARRPHMVLAYLTAPTAICFQHFFKMQAGATVGVDARGNATLDARALFAEFAEQQPAIREVLQSSYAAVHAMKSDRINYRVVIPDVARNPANHSRLVWHWAGSCGAGRVVDPGDFSVLGTRGLHIADMSVPLCPPDGGAMAMAYLTGHLAAAQMLRSL